jgi:membrane-bound ClpP family serine protease
MKMRGRLILAIVSTILEEAAMVAAVVWGLPLLGVHIPIWILIVVMIGWAAYAIFTFRKGTHALRRKPVSGMLNMVGSRGEVVNPLSPEGVVRIGGELWAAKSAGGEIKLGEEVLVVEQDRLKLTVHRSSDVSSEKAE